MSGSLNPEDHQRVSLYLPIPLFVRLFPPPSHAAIPRGADDVAFTLDDPSAFEDDAITCDPLWWPEGGVLRADGGGYHPLDTFICQQLWETVSELHDCTIRPRKKKLFLVMKKFKFHQAGRLFFSFFFFYKIYIFYLSGEIATLTKNFGCLKSLLYLQTWTWRTKIIVNITSMCISFVFKMKLFDLYYIFRLGWFFFFLILMTRKVTRNKAFFWPYMIALLHSTLWYAS